MCHAQLLERFLSNGFEHAVSSSHNWREWQLRWDQCDGCWDKTTYSFGDIISDSFGHRDSSPDARRRRFAVINAVLRGPGKSHFIGDTCVPSVAYWDDFSIVAFYAANACRQSRRRCGECGCTAKSARAIRKCRFGGCRRNGGHHPARRAFTGRSQRVAEKVGVAAGYIIRKVRALRAQDRALHAAEEPAGESASAAALAPHHAILETILGGGFDEVMIQLITDTSSPSFSKLHQGHSSMLQLATAQSSSA